MDTCYNDVLTYNLHSAAPGDGVEERGLGGDLAAVLARARKLQVPQDHAVLVRGARLGINAGSFDRQSSEEKQINERAMAL